MIKPLSLLFFVSSLAFADGLAYNKDHTHLAENHTTIKLTPLQQKQIERSRIITLTSSQLSRLRKIGAACPANLEVIPSYFDDCTCGMGPLAVWFISGEVEIPNAYIPKKCDSDGADPSTPFSGMVIDPDGRLWINMKAIPDSSIQAALIEAATKHRIINSIPKDKPSYCFISTPPKKVIRNRKAIQKTINSIHLISKPLNIHLYAPGFTDISN